jgi:hypothetical protein
MARGIEPLEAAEAALQHDCLRRARGACIDQGADRCQGGVGYAWCHDAVRCAASRQCSVMMTVLMIMVMIVMVIMIVVMLGSRGFGIALHQGIDHLA